MSVDANARSCLICFTLAPTSAITQVRRRHSPARSLVTAENRSNRPSATIPKSITSPLQKDSPLSPGERGRGEGKGPNRPARTLAHNTCHRQGVVVDRARRERARLDHDLNHRQISSQRSLADHKARFRNSRPQRLHMLLIPGLHGADHRHL